MAGIGTKITVDLGDEALCKAVKIIAIERGLSIRQVVVEALRDWLEKCEDEEDIAAYREVKGEPSRPFREFLAELEQEESELSDQNSPQNSTGDISTASSHSRASQ
ncbi:MAG: hypothetical protein EXR50_01530 [Dehalococcoidia bacterium]|nr:hypothetical protein [Dehalococcoidia bacterium]